MNPLNYASLEASQRLVEVGIVLWTEAYYSETIYIDSPFFTEVPQGSTNAARQPIKVSIERHIPKPQMAEVWRELPEGTELVKGKDITTAWLMVNDFMSGDNQNTNPTDALIGLLIWARKEKGGEDDPEI